MAYTSSLLNRLLAFDPIVDYDKEFIRQLKRDIEILLNTQASLLEWPNAYKELNRSIVSVGMPDYLSMPFEPDSSFLHLCKTIESMLAAFEPRLKEIRVEVIDAYMKANSVVHLRISAIIGAPYKEKVITMESSINPITNNASVL